jgi:hypothetical protein
MKTWEELVAMEPCILEDWYDDGVRCLIVRGPSALCAYLGVPLTHPLAGKDHNDIPIECHGGLTYSGEGDGKYRPKDFFWYGWDYGHCYDYSFYFDKISLDQHDAKKWLVDNVKEDMQDAIYTFRKLMKLTEGRQ